MRPATARGILTGILYYYPADIPPSEKAGNVHISGDPRVSNARRGSQAGLLWIRTSKLYSEDGLEFRLAMEEKFRWD